MVIPQYYENPHILHVNTMPNRAYFIPDARRNDAPCGTPGNLPAVPAAERNLAVPLLPQHL